MIEKQGTICTYAQIFDQEGFTRMNVRANLHELIHKGERKIHMMDDLQNGPVDEPAGDQPTETPAAEPVPTPEAAPEEAAPAE